MVARTRQCGLCGEWLSRTAFDGQAKDCSACRRTEAQRPPRGRTPIEKALTPRGAKAAIMEEARARSEAEGMAYEVDHVIPVQGKVRRNSDDWVLVCGLDIPSNWEIVPKSENRGKWMFLRPR